MNPLMADPLFRQFFGGQLGGERDLTRKEQSLGSGVIVTSDGYILTANHVVAEADEVKVSVNGDKREYPARIIGKDALSDVAVLKIDATGLPAITLGDSDQIEVGDVVLAIGNPFGVGQTVTMGIVSAMNRSGVGINGYEDFIQTDAAINPGNSGGALVDTQGRLVGINTAIISRTGGYQGIGFAVPVNMAHNVMERIISGGKVKRGYLGINPQDVTSDLAQEFNLANATGALVGDVGEDTPAGKAGIRAGDVILSIENRIVNDANSLRIIVSEFSPGTTVKIRLIRNGHEKVIAVKLGELPGDNFAADGNKGSGGAGTSVTDALDGVEVTEIDDQVRQQLRVPRALQGVVVSAVKETSNAAEAGLRQGDVIVEINRQPVTNTDEAVDICKAAKGKHIVLKIWRREESGFAATHFMSVDNTRHQD